jgi:hypothetical protein
MVILGQILRVGEQFRVDQAMELDLNEVSSHAMSEV